MRTAHTIPLVLAATAVLLAPGGSVASSTASSTAPAPGTTVAATAPTGTVSLTVPEVGFTADDPWPDDVRRGRAYSGDLRFAAGPGTTVTDVLVTATGGSVACHARDRTTVDHVTTVPCRLRGGAPSRPGGGDGRTVVVELTVVTTTGTSSASWSHRVTDG